MEHLPLKFFMKIQAHLIGNPGEGFKMMLHLMNEARVATAMQSFGGLKQLLLTQNNMPVKEKLLENQLLNFH